MIEQIYSELNIPLEVREKLEIYHGLLLKWQKAVNLVSPKSLDEAWDRHFADSLQLAAYIPEGAKVLVDIGSGAGFPGLVLAAAFPDLSVHLVESDMKKCQFLRTVVREMGDRNSDSHVSRGANFSTLIHNERIEQAYDVAVPDVITARALASLDKLFDLVFPWIEKNPACEMVFLKGVRAEEEVEQAKELYDFDVKFFDSITDQEAQILKISNLRKK